VNQETTIQESRMPFLQGWLGSIALHGLMFLSLFPLFRQSLITIHNEPFHWNVALVQSTPTAHESVQVADATTPAVLKQPDLTATAPHAKRTTHQATPSAQPITSLARKSEAPVTPTSMPDSPLLVTSPIELPPPLVQAHEPPRQPTDTPVSSTTQAPQQEVAAAVAPLKENTPPTDTTRPSPVPPTASDTPAASAIRPDYGWLQQAIFRRLEELKRSSHPSLDDSRPLKVTVKAVVSREGILLDSAVVKSSGLDRIDQEAMALVQRAFPMQLDHPLDRQQVAMRIPITYSRE
jgi:outer membrane biosynthesis protein TonB